MVMTRRRPTRGLIPWQPFRELEEISRHFDSIFDRPLTPARKRLSAEGKEWAPAIEVIEEEDKFVVKAELPGMKKENIDISVSDETLTIKGERKSENEVKEENYHYCERYYGSFSRSITLPYSVDAQQIEANYESGVLEVSLPKTPEVKPQKISISSKKEETGK